MKKIVKIILVVFLLLIVAAVAVPFLFKDKIMQQVKTTANENLNAKLDFKDLDISLFRNFPDLSLRLIDFSIIGINDFKNDTLVYVHQLDVGVNLWKVISGSQTEIKKIYVEQPLINLIGLKNGKVNWDITKPSKETASAGESKPFKVSLKKYKISNGVMRYHDEGLNYDLTLEGLDHEGTGDFTQDLFTLSTVTEIAQVNTTYGGVRYLYNSKANLKADLDMDMKNMKFTFKQNELVLNDMLLNFDGYVAMPAKDITMDIKFSSPKNDFKNFMSLIPGVYREGFKDVKSSGTMSFKGFVKGTYNDKSMPGFGVEVMVNNGHFQYASLPTPINNVNMDLKIQNPDGVPDHTDINLNKLHLELGTEPFDARLSLKTPISNAQFDGMMKGKINLANISSMVPLEKGTSISGQIAADLSVKGDMKSIEQKNYQNINASGTFAMNQFSFKSNDFKQGVSLDNLLLTFNPSNVTLNNLAMRIGKTDLRAKGTLDNLLAYYFKPNQLLKGSLDIISSQIDLNEFMTPTNTANTTATATPDTSKLSVIPIPENVEFVMTASVGKLIYDNVILSNMKGNISMRDQALGMNDVKFNTLDGLVGMEGIYQTKDKKNPVFKYSLDVKNLDIKQTTQTFATVKKMAPIAERCAGKYSSQFTINGKMDAHMQPVMSSLNGNGKLQTQSVTVTNFEPLSKLADAIKMQQFKTLAMSNLNISFKFMDGRVYVDPFETSWQGAKTKIEGSNGFDQSIDYKVIIAVPKAMIPSAATSMVTGLMSQINSKVGSNLSVPDPVNFKIDLGGFVNKPTVKTSLNSSGKSVTDDLKAKATDEAKKKVDEAKAKAQAEVDKAKKEAEDKVKTETDRLKKQADDAAAKAKKEAEDKIKNQAKDKLKGLFGK